MSVISQDSKFKVRFFPRLGSFDLVDLMNDGTDVTNEKELRACINSISQVIPADFKPTWEHVANSWDFTSPPKYWKTLGEISIPYYLYNQMACMGCSSFSSIRVPNTGVIFGSALASSWVSEIEKSSPKDSWLEVYYTNLFDITSSPRFHNSNVLKASKAVSVPWFKEFYCEDFVFVRGMLDELAVMYPGSALHSVLGELVMADVNKAPSIHSWKEYLSDPNRLPMEWWYPLFSEEQDFSHYLIDYEKDDMLEYDRQTCAINEDGVSVMFLEVNGPYVYA